MSEHLLVRACRMEEVERTPVWLMRQTGRYLKEYAKIKRGYSFLEMCKKPKIVAKLTLLPVKKLGVDAAILFSDLLIPIEAMGMKVKFKEGGPVISNPIRNAEGVDSLRAPSPEDAIFLSEAVHLVKERLKIPLIGFCGAPFTLVSYMIEGGGSVNYENTKAMMYNSKAYKKLMDKVSDAVILFIDAQIEAGIDVLQIFDSWAGCLSPKDYEKYVLSYTKKVVKSVKDQVPIIHFATNASTLLKLMKKGGGNVIGIDWRINIDEAWRTMGYDVGIQGNLDPAVLLAPVRVLEENVRDILERVNSRPGHIFNLGHGVLPQTPVSKVVAMVKFVKKLSKR